MTSSRVPQDREDITSKLLTLAEDVDEYIRAFREAEAMERMPPFRMSKTLSSWRYTILVIRENVELMK